MFTQMQTKKPPVTVDLYILYHWGFKAIVF